MTSATLTPTATAADGRYPRADHNTNPCDAAMSAGLAVVDVANRALAPHGLHLRIWFEPCGAECIVTATVEPI